MKKILISIISIIAGLATLSRAADITGVVTDADKQFLPGVSVQLIALPDSTRVGYVLTDPEGSFSFTGVRPGKYSLQLDMTGMEPVSQLLGINDSTETIALKDIRLHEDAVMLDEATVTAVRAAVVARQDTLEFNAGSFHTSPNASVEDLLKKLPGVEVGSDGSLSSGGKTISKILVDGKEFFADDPKMASKNLPSEMVEKVQVIDRKSESARITGVDDGEDETVINLTVKKGMNNGWFGTAAAGYGTDNRYQANFNINRFANGNQYTILGGLNNINEMGFTDMGRGRFKDFGGNNGINTSGSLGFNFNIGNEETFRIGGNIMYTYTDRDSRSRSETQYLFPDSVSYNRGGLQSRDRGHALRAQFRMRWNISPSDLLDFRPEFSMNIRRAESRDSSVLYASAAAEDLVNRNFAMQGNRGIDYSASGRLIYTHKFLSHPGRSISAQADYSFSDNIQKQTSWNDIEYYLRQEDSELLFQYIDNHQWSNYIRGKLTWTEPLGDPARKNYLELSYMASMRFNYADKLAYDLPTGYVNPEITGLPAYTSLPDSATENYQLSNRFRNRFSSQELQIGYKKVSDKYTLNTGLVFSPSSSSSDDLINPERNISTRWVFNVAPFLRFRYKFSKQTSFMAHYRARTTQPSLSQLQPVADISDPLNIKVGNPDLKPTFTQNIAMHFNSFNTESQQSIFAVANASFALNSIVARTITDSNTGIRTSSYANADGNWNIFGMFMLNQPFRNRKWRFNTRFQGLYSSNAGYINGEFNRSGNLSLAPSAGLTFSSDIFQMTVNPTYSFQMATSSLKDQANRYTHNYGFTADASLYLPFGMEISSDIAFNKTSGFSQGFDNTQWLWNAEVSYSLLRDKSLTLSARACDILGMKKNISRSVSANMITDNEYNDLTRYVMFSISWKFNTTGRKQQNKLPGTPPDMPADSPRQPPHHNEGPGGRPPHNGLRGM